MPEEQEPEAQETQTETPETEEAPVELGPDFFSGDVNNLPDGIKEIMDGAQGEVEGKPEDEEKLWLGRYKKPEDLEDHARHFQSEADRQKARAERAEAELESSKNSEVQRMMNEIQSDPTKMERLRSIAQNTEEVETPEFFDPTDVTNPNSKSQAWLKSLVAKEAEKLVKGMIGPELAQLKQREEAKDLISQHQELNDPETAAAFRQFVQSRQNGVSLSDFYQLFLASQGEDPGPAGDVERAPTRAPARRPRGVGRRPSRRANLTPQEQESLRILRLATLGSDWDGQ